MMVGRFIVSLCVLCPIQVFFNFFNGDVSICRQNAVKLRSMLCLWFLSRRGSFSCDRKLTENFVLCGLVRRQPQGDLTTFS